MVKGKAKGPLFANVELQFASGLCFISRNAVCASLHCVCLIVPGIVFAQEYLVVDAQPKHVLVCGWGEQSFMRSILRELSYGQVALPPGSEVTFVNMHDRETSLEQAVHVSQCGCARLHCMPWPAGVNILHHSTTYQQFDWGPILGFQC